MEKTNQPENKPRIILLTKEISEETLTPLKEKLLQWELEDTEESSNLKEFKPEPIILHISSYGGEAYSMWSFIDLIESMKTPVHTYNGFSMSAGVPIFLSGKKRFVTPHTTFMLHSTTSWIIGKAPRIKSDFDEVNRLDTMYINYIAKKTTIPIDKLKQMIEMQTDWYIGHEEALKYQFATERGN